MYSNKLEKDLKIATIPIVKDLEKFLKGDDNQIMHPERFNRADVLKIMEDDIWVFMCQMMLKPEDPAKKRFTPEMIEYYDEIPENTKRVLLVDPASAENTIVTGKHPYIVFHDL